DRRLSQAAAYIGRECESGAGARTSRHKKRSRRLSRGHGGFTRAHGETDQGWKVSGRMRGRKTDGGFRCEMGQWAGSPRSIGGRTLRGSETQITVGTLALFVRNLYVIYICTHHPGGGCLICDLFTSWTMGPLGPGQAWA